MYDSIKKILFCLPPEHAHELTSCIIKNAFYIKPLSNYLLNQNFITDPILNQKILGLNFMNPVGLAAGFDKNATLFKSMPMLGFGFSEVGTITPLAQKGNPKPRLFRYPQEQSLQNAMGCKNHGGKEILKTVKEHYPVIIP